MAQCRRCVHDITRQCMVLHTVIPRDKESVEHDCLHWAPIPDTPAETIIARWMDGHPEDIVGLWALHDMVAGDTDPPAGQKAEAWRLLYTATYIDSVSRDAVIGAIIPF